MEIEEKKLDDNQIAIKIIELCKDSEGGIQHDHLSRSLEVPEERTVRVLNQLISRGFITVKANREGIPVYHYQDPEKAKKFAGLDRDSLNVYQLLNDASHNGLTKIEIKSKSGLNPSTITTILNTLKKRNLVKSEKAVNQKKNVWLLFELEASEAVKGNMFYNKGEFDLKLVEGIYDKVLRYIESEASKQGEVSKKEIAISLRSRADFANEDLKDEDIQSILNILIYDDKIEETGNQSYRICKWDTTVRSSVLTATPCGTCPVFNECKEGSIISPEKCIYYLDW